MTIFFIIASSLILILSGKALRGDGIIWIFKALQSGLPYFDEPPYRLLGIIPQIPLIILSRLSANFSPSLLYVLYSTMLVIFVNFPVMFYFICFFIIIYVGCVLFLFLERTNGDDMLKANYTLNHVCYCCFIFIAFVGVFLFYFVLFVLHLFFI